MSTQVQTNALYSVVIGLHLRSLFLAKDGGVAFQSPDTLLLSLIFYSLFWLEWLHEGWPREVGQVGVHNQLRFGLALVSITFLSFSFMFVLDAKSVVLGHRSIIESPYTWFAAYLVVVCVWQYLYQPSESLSGHEPPLRLLWAFLNFAALLVFVTIYSLSLWGGQHGPVLMWCVAVYVGLRWVVAAIKLARSTAVTASEGL